ncbi:MAG: glycosyltransferase [Patescibacteria group bacterium]|nr:glycosyltransferase [Patescibacteria group bacterium]
MDPRPKRFPKISIIVPAYNEGKTIKRTIQSLLSLNYSKRLLEILVIDDGSKDDTFEIAKKFPQIKSFTKKNGGKGSAINLGLKKATGEFVAIMDADSFVSKHMLKRMIGYFENEKVMAVTPTLKVHSPKGFLQRFQYIEYLISVILKKIFSYIGGIYVTPGPFSIYRALFFKKHGGFDENNLTEDMEIALRIQHKGYEIENSINAVVTTVAPNNFKALLHQRMRWYTGMIENVWAYRSLFGAHTGNLGVFVMPVMALSIAMSLTYLIYYGTSIFSNVWHNIYQVYLVGFDLDVVTRSLQNLSLINLINPFSVLVVLMITFMLTILALAKIYSKDKANLPGTTLLYIFIYGPISGFWWITTVLYKVLRLQVKW